jgi:hypothetical protein
MPRPTKPMCLKLRALHTVSCSIGDGDGPPLR